MDIFLIEITDGVIGKESYYIASGEDYLDDICFAYEIIEEFLYKNSSYPPIEDIISEMREEGTSIDEFEAEEVLMEMVMCELSYTKKLATIEDIETYSIIPNSFLYDDSEELLNYIKLLNREKNIDYILSE